MIDCKGMGHGAQGTGIVTEQMKQYFVEITKL